MTRLPPLLAAAPLCAALTLTAALPAAAETPSPWSGVARPAAGAPRAIGSYANGCIQGAAALTLEGPGWRVIRPHRNRFWGHPDLLAVVRDLGRQVRAATGLNIVVADIAQPRGGPASGHASHQIGLDADIRFVLAPDGPLDPRLRDEGTELSMLTADAKAMDPARWTERQLTLLRLAAQQPAVDRIFVNPVIKREACRAATGDRRWLSKVVPWYGHDGHLHVRVHCPAGSSECRGQPPLPDDDGCGAALAWWFTDEPHRRSFTRPARPPAPPDACRTVLER